MSSFGNIIQHIIVASVPVLCAITLHEAAHGWVASCLGDKTALMMGRVTLNPIKHIDLFGTIILPILMIILSKFTFVFGWAKPVPVNWKNLKNPRRDMVLVALAGPLANLLMALFWAAIARFSIMFVATSSMGDGVATFFFTAGLVGVYINVILLILNLIPIPPLDGSRIVSSLLSHAARRVYESIEPYGIWILLGLLVFGFLSGVLSPIILYLMKWVSPG